jgi:RIO kinase 1
VRVPVPYPVQIDGTEILMELVTVDGEAAPRLAQTRRRATCCVRTSTSCATR